MPVSRCYAGTCAYTNQLYVIGGCDAKGKIPHLKSVFTYFLLIKLYKIFYY